MMHIKESEKIPNKLIMVIEILVLVSALISTGICFCSELSEYLWLLPLGYLLCFALVIFKREYVIHNIFLVIIVGVYYIRDVIIPALFYCANIDPWNLRANYEHYHRIYNTQATVTIMLLELVSAFLIIRLFGERYTLRNEPEYRREQGSILNIAVIAAGIFLIIREPYYLGSYDMIFQFYAYEAVSYKAILLSVASVLVSVWLVIVIKRQKRMPDIIKVCLTGIVWCIFCVEASLGSNEYHAISRWDFILNFLIGGIILMWLYPKYKKALLYALGITGLLGIGILSVFRGFSAAMFFCYTNFNDYFAGPTNISFAVDMCQSNNFEIGFQTFIGDVFGNVPIINHYLPEKNNLVVYFSKTIYGIRSDQYDKIVPFSGQMFAYLSYPGVVLGNALITFITLITGYWAKKLNNLFLCYTVLFIAVIFCLGTIFNINIVFQYLSITIFPILFVAVVDAIVGRLIKDKLFRERKKS